MPETKKKVVHIIGAGIAGLTVAHELSLFPDHFEVHIFEKNPQCGGKARSVDWKDENGKRIGPGEHGMRGYFSLYNSLYQTMKEIPYEKGTVIDNLFATEIILKHGLSQDEKDRVTMSSRKEGTLHRLLDSLRTARFLRRLGLTWGELVYASKMVLGLLFLSPKRYAGFEFRQFLGPSCRTKEFQQFIYRLPEIVVAAKTYSSAIAVAGMYLTFLAEPLLSGKHRRRINSFMNGPTNERFIDPWRAHLSKQGVQFHCDTQVKSILIDTQLRAVGVETFDYGSQTADIVIAATPSRMVPTLLPEALRDKVPIRDSYREEWSNGVQYFLPDVPAGWEYAVGKGVCQLDSVYSLVYTIQRNGEYAWKDVKFPDGCKAILSLVFSNKDKARPGCKSVEESTPDELAAECLAQIGFPLTNTPQRACPDLEHKKWSDFEKVQERYEGFDRSLQPKKIKPGELPDYVLLNDAALYIPEPSEVENEPKNTTEIEGLYVAGEYTVCETRGPTMERANESGKRCAADIVKSQKLIYDEKRFATSKFALRWFRDLDELWFTKVPWADPLIFQLVRLLFFAVVASVFYWLGSR